MRKGPVWFFSAHRALVPVGIFLLACGLGGCDLPGAAGAANSTAGSLSAASSSTDIVAIEASHPRGTAARFDASNASTASISTQKEPAVQEEPQLPPVDDLLITPMEGAGDPAGNALLSVHFAKGSEIADEIPLLVDKKTFVLKRDQKDTLLFNGMVDFDFDLFLQEQADRRKLIEETKSTASVTFDKRALVSEDRFEFLDPDAVQLARAKSLPIRIPISTISMPPIAVDPTRELMITDLSVVNDPTRTFDICGNVGNPNGAWTFKTLMTEMANQPVTGIDPAIFVESWLQTWNLNNTINTFPVPARTNIGPLVLNSWPRIGGKLDLNRSPFRLLAIVNRVDLRANPVYGGSGGNAGEGRLVFGVVNRNSNGGCSAMRFTVIFEYGVPIRGCTATKTYAQQWVNLGNIALGSAAFNPALQAITDQFTKANAAPTKPHGSAINQVRTDENALANPWELREFHLVAASGPLTLVSTKQTPHHTRNNSAQLANYINSNSAAILNSTYVVPQTWVPGGSPFLTGSNFNLSIADPAVWKAPAVGNQERHLFSLGTCNGCHGGEARANGNPVSFANETSFTHITERMPTAQSVLSKFLLGSGSLAVPTTFPKNDPINGIPQRNFGDLFRRQQDMANLINNSCQATALLQAVQFQPLRMAH